MKNPRFCNTRKHLLTNVWYLGLPRNMSTRRSAKAFKAFEGRRNSIIAMRRKSQMQTLGANNIYGVTGNPLGIQGRPSRSSQISVKDVFEGHGAHANSAYDPEENTGNSLRLHNLGQTTWREANTNIWAKRFFLTTVSSFYYDRTGY